MRFDSLRDFISECAKSGDLSEIANADWNLEIGALTELMAERKGPVLLFDHIKDYRAGYRILTNCFTTLKRTAMVHGLPVGLTPLQTLKAYKERLRSFKPVPPTVVETGPIKQNVMLDKDVDLFRLPVPKWHKLDGGRFIGTGCCVITKDPDTGWVNIGTYRCMLQGKNKVTIKANAGKHGRLMMDKYHARGESCPVAIALGQDPAVWAAASDAGVRGGVSEYEFAGWLRGAPVEVTKGEVTGLPIPATAEIVIEGEVPPPPFEKLIEGPFGEWTGYYSDRTIGVQPVMNVRAVLHRDAPVMLGVPPLKPPIPFDFAIPKWAVAVWDQIENADIPGVTGVWFLGGAMSPDVVVIAIKQQYAGHAKQAAVVASACRAGTYGSRVVIVVDDDVDITNAQEVLWAVTFRSRAEDVDIVRGLWTTPADPTMNQADRDRDNVTSGRIIINACRPWERIKDFPPVNKLSSEDRDQVLRKWSHLFAQNASDSDKS